MTNPSGRLRQLIRQNSALARTRYPELSQQQLTVLRDLSSRLCLSLCRNELLYFDGRWYVTHSGLLQIAHRRGCFGIECIIERKLSQPTQRFWVFRATVYKSARCRGFVGYGDADPSNVSALVHGAEMRVAETRAVNRALRKAYGIGICSVEEVGSLPEPASSACEAKKLPRPANGNGSFGGRTVRDRLCQLIRQHHLDANLVKAYATDFCGVKVLREATRDQVENFVKHLAEWAESDCNALLCQLNSYLGQKAEQESKGAA